MKKFVLMFIPALICGVVFTSCGSNKAEPKEEKAVGEIQEVSDWWQPILQKHNVEPVGYNNFDKVFAMGKEGNAINNGICTLKVATVLVKLEDIDSYIIIVADTIYHNIQEGVLEMEAGVAKVYKMNSDVLEPSVAHMNVNRIKL